MTWSNRRSRLRSATNASRRLITDIEAFLSGDYATCLQRHGEAVPWWASLNRPAHGDLRDLQEAQRPLPGRNDPIEASLSDAWICAERLLVREVLAFVDGDSDLLRLVQRSVLVPLELHLIEQAATSALTALELVQAARQALRADT